MIRTARPGPGNGWRHTISSGRLQLLADPAHLVLEQAAERFHQLEGHVLGQPADVVVALDGGGAVAALDFDHVGIEGALDQVAGVLQPARRLLEDPDEQLAHDLALVLGVGDAGESLEVAVGGPHVDQLDALVALEGLDHLLALAGAEQSGIDEDARELGPDRLVDQRGSHRRVDTARQRADHPPEPTCARTAATCCSMIDVIVHGPASGQVVEELAEHLLAVRRVRHLGVVLDAPDAPVRRLQRGHRGASRWRSRRSRRGPW